MTDVPIIISDDEADWWILRQTQGKDFLAIPLGGIPPKIEYYIAHERAVTEDWITLIDVGPMPHDTQQLYRRYRLNAAGKRRRTQLGLKFGQLGQVTQKQ